MNIRGSRSAWPATRIRAADGGLNRAAISQRSATMGASADP